MGDEIACGMCIMDKLAAKRKEFGKMRFVFCYACQDGGGKIPGCAHGMGSCDRQANKK